MEFLGFERPDGSFGARNYVLVVPSVACACEVAHALSGRMDGVVSFLHHQGCCQLPPDIEVIERTLIGLGLNPNVAAVLVMSLGCETVDADRIADGVARSGKQVELLRIQESGGYSKALDKGLKIARNMVDAASKVKRCYTDIGNLTVGLKCGASDTTSGLASNPAVGRFADRLIEAGGTVIMGETTEFIGAEHLVAKRAKDDRVRRAFLKIVSRMEDRIKALGFDMRGSQPTQGNIAGGITTIEEKSLGAVAKGGTAPIMGVLEYSARPPGKGFYIMDTPGFEPQVLTGLAAGGAQIIVFTTGSGAPQGFPTTPVIKVCGNPITCKLMEEHIDLCLADLLKGGKTLDEAGYEVLREAVDVASGKRTKAEILGYDMTADIYVQGPTI